MKRAGKGRRANATGRSDGQERFFMLTYSMSKSLAWRSLTGAAIKVFIELRHHYDGTNNGQLFLSYGNAAKRLGLSRSTIKRAFDELQEKGFVRKTRQGARQCRLASTWAVTDRPLREGEAASNDWRRWQPQPLKNGTSVRLRHTDEPDGTATVPMEGDCAA